MPASLPGSTLAENLANPSAGAAVLMDGLSGPKGSPFDKDQSGNASTGALATGIGWGPQLLIGAGQLFNPTTGAPGSGFTDDTGAGGTYSNSSIIYIGGGRSTATGTSNPYTAGYLPTNAGNGGSRDGGAGPAFTGFVGKIVTAAGTVANGAAVETGWTNRTGRTLTVGQSTLGSSTAAQAAPA